MKVSKSNAMKKMLSRGIKLAKKGRIPDEGMMRNLIYETLPNGWHYQVEFIHDTRVFSKPYVAVYAFRPPRSFCAKQADICLMKEVK